MERQMPSTLFLKASFLFVCCLGVSEAGSAELRVWNGGLTSDPRSIDVTLVNSTGGDAWDFVNVPLGGVSAFSSALSDGNYTARVYAQPQGNVTFSANISLSSGNFYTLALVTVNNATVRNLTVALLHADDLSAPSNSSTARLKLTQLLPGLPVSVFASPVSAAPARRASFRDADGPLFANVFFGAVTPSISLPAGRWSLSFQANNTVLTTLDVSLVAGGVHTVTLYRSVAGSAVANVVVDGVFVYPTLRVADFSPAGGTVILASDTGLQQTKIGKNVSYASFGPYVSPAVPEFGSLAVVDAANGTIVDSVSGMYFAGQDPTSTLTWFAAGGSENFIFADYDPSPPATRESALLQLVNIVANVSAVDVRFDALLIFSDVPPGAVSNYVTVPAGTYHLRVFASGTEAPVLYDAPALTVGAGNVSTLVVAGGSEVSSVNSHIDATYVYLRVAFVNTVSGSSPSVMFGNTVVFSDVPFGTIAPYTDVPFLASDFSSRINVTVVEGWQWTVTAENMDFAGGDAYTLVLSGVPGESPLVLSQLIDNVPAAPGFVSVRLMHSMPSAPPLTVYVAYNDLAPPVAVNLSYAECTDWISLPPAVSPANEYRFSFLNASYGLVAYYLADYSPGQASTLLAVGGSVSAISFTNGVVEPVTNFRVINAGPAVDVIVNGLVRWSNVSASSGYASFPASNSYNFSFTSPDTIYPVIANSSGLSYPPLANTTLFLFPASGFFQRNVVATVARDGTGGGLPGANATQVRFVHASLDMQIVEILIDGVVVVPVFSFGDIGSYLLLTAGYHRVNLWYANTTQSVFSMTSYFAPSTIYTVVFEAPVTLLRCVTFVDNGDDAPAPPWSPTTTTGSPITTTTGSSPAPEWYNEWDTITISIVAIGGGAVLIVAGTLVGVLLYRRHRMRSEYYPLY